MNTRHNEILKTNTNQFVFRSHTTTGKYSQWFDHADISFGDVFNKSDFEFYPHKISFLVPLFKKDLFLVRSESKSGIFSEQFIYCANPQDFKIQSFNTWFFNFLKSVVLHSLSLWTFLILTLSKQDFVSWVGLVVPLCLYLIFRYFNRSYLIEKMMLSELIIWIMLLSSFYCLQL